MHRYTAYPEVHRCDVQDKAVVRSLWTIQSVTSVSKNFDISYPVTSIVLTSLYTPILVWRDMADIYLDHSRI